MNMRGVPFQTYTTRGGTYTADQNGLIYGVNVNGPDLGDMVRSGCTEENPT